MKDVLNGIIRHLLTSLGGAGFFVSQDETQMVASALLTIVGFTWSIYEKYKAMKAAK